MQPTNILKPFIITSIINAVITIVCYNLWGFEISLLVVIILSSGFIIMGMTGLENTIIQSHNNKK